MILLKKLPSSKIFVYDNGSNDNSKKIAKKHGANVIRVNSKGKGNVVKNMFSNSHDGDYFVMVDGDDTYGISQKLIRC